MQRLLVAFIVAVAMSAAAPAQLLWGDDFDNQGIIGSPAGPYTVGAVGTFPPATGGGVAATGYWDSWYQTAGAEGGISNTQARSAPNSLEVGGLGVGGSGCDVVQWHQGASVDPNVYNAPVFGIPPTGGPWPQAGVATTNASDLGGIWEYRAWNYVPSALPTGTDSHFFIVNDVHSNPAPGGPSQWVCQVQFNHLTGIISDDQRPPSTPTNIIYDQWVEIVATFDLDNDACCITYNGRDVGNGPMFVSPAWNPGTGNRQLANLDLFSIGATSYWDDVTLTRTGTGPLFQVNQPNASGDLGGLQGNALCGAVTIADISSGLGIPVNLASAGPATFFDSILAAGPAIPLGAPVTITSPSGQIVNTNLASPLILWLSGVQLGLNLPHPGGGNVTLTNYVPTTPLTASIQHIVIDVSSPDSFSLSQASTLIAQ